MNSQERTQASPSIPTPWTAREAVDWLQPPRVNDHKMTRGVLAARIGSSQYPGAAVLGVSAAWRAGIGMLRYLAPVADNPPAYGLPSPAAAVLAARPETLFGEGTCDAWLLGSGTDADNRSEEETAALNHLLAGSAPLVLDAGALGLALTRTPESAPAVLTPHAGEFLRLWAAADLGPLTQIVTDDAGSGKVTPASVKLLATRLSATVLLKGSTSIVATPGGLLISVGPATPWLATAGTGDVLAGILGALVARHASAVREAPEVLGPLAATAALVHDTAARVASGDDSQDPARCAGAPITAFDVVDAVPRAVQLLR